MSESALRNRNIAVVAIAFLLALIVALVWKLRFFDNVNAQLNTAQSSLVTQSATAKKLEASLTAQRIAEVNRDLAERQVTVFRQRFRSLNYDLNSSPGAREATFRRVLNEYFTDYGVELRRELIQAADESGVIIATSVKVQTPPQNPEDVVAPPTGFIKPLDGGGTMSVTITGTLPNILRFFERINQSEILMTVGSSTQTGLKLENTASDASIIRATFTITPYLLATGPDAALPGGGATTSAASGPSGQQPVSSG